VPSSLSTQKSRVWEANRCTLDQTIPLPLRNPWSQEPICWIKESGLHFRPCPLNISL
jgi:hypothetical protein